MAAAAAAARGLGGDAADPPPPGFSNATVGGSLHDRASMEGQMHYTTMSVAINGTCLALQLALFSGLLLHRRTSQWLAPRLPRGPGARPAHCWLGWAAEAWRRREELYAQDADGAMVVRFCILGLKVSAVGTALAFGLIPLYAQGNGGQLGLNVVSLSNMRDTDRFWMVVVAAYALVGCFFHFCATEWRHFTSFRRTRLERQAQGLAGAGAAQAQRSILVEDVPASAGSPDGSGVRAFFAKLFPPGSIHCCLVHPDTKALHGNTGALLRGAGRRTVAEMRQALRLERAPRAAAVAPPPAPLLLVAGEVVDTNTPVELEGERPPPAGRGARSCGRACGRAWSSTAGSIGHRGCQVLALAQDVTIGSDGSQTAFVTFTSVADRVVAEQLLLSHSGRWKACAAPEARDIVWPNVALSLRQLQARWVVAVLGVAVGLVFWSFFVGSAQAFANVDKWEQLLAVKSSYPKLYTFVRTYLPVLVLMGLQYVLPYALWVGVVCYEKCKVKSDTMRRVLWRNLLYQCVTLYVTIISQSITNLDFKDHVGKAMEQTPSDLLGNLSDGVPPVASYFICYVMARVSITLPLLLLCPMLSFGGPAHPDLAYEAANLGLILVLGLTYSVIAPVIMPVCMLYFGLAALVYCWLFRYAYTPEFDSGGALWRELFNGVVLGLLFGTLSLAALVGTYAGWDSNHFIAMLVLAALVVFLFGAATQHFASPSQFTSLEDACDVDAACATPVAALLPGDYYVDPILKAASEDSQQPDLEEGCVEAPSAGPEQEAEDDPGPVALAPDVEKMSLRYPTVEV